ncbi:hypothetical protein ITG09_06830 [Vibrio cyclitrophicus]|nr:hypothetical protein [Vibrio cyclitrophicus]UPR53331.1 hypothetical protein ITG09_06830 [Vibrio cyclitrophicus]
MTREITVRGFVTWALLVLVYFIFAVLNTHGELVYSETKVRFLGEDQPRFGGLYAYFKLADGTRLEAIIGRETSAKFKYRKQWDGRVCDVVYYRNESLVFNETHTLESMKCEGIDVYNKNEQPR